MNKSTQTTVDFDTHRSSYLEYLELGLFIALELF